MTMFIGDPAAFAARQQNDILEHHAKRAELQRWMQEIPSDQLAILIQLLNDIYVAHSSEVAASYHLGQASAIMAVKHDRCICGTDHAQEMLDEEAAKLSSGNSIPVQHQADPMQDTLDYWHMNRAGDREGFLCRHCAFHYESVGTRAKHGKCEGCGTKPGNRSEDSA